MAKTTKYTANILVCCCCHYLERSLVKPAMQPILTRLWLSPWWFSSYRGQIVIPGLVYVLAWLTKSTLPPLSRSPWWQKMSRQSPNHPIHLILPQQTFFSFSKSKTRAGWPVAIPEQLQDKLGKGYANHCRRWVCHSLSPALWGL